MRTAIIGAGISGLTAARQLKAKGHEVSVFDKGRGPGGRLSTRRADTPLGQLRFDHGAPYFEASHPKFLADLENLATQGAVAKWSPRCVHIGPSNTITPETNHDVWVGQPGMNGLIRTLSADLDVQWGARLSSLTETETGWQLRFENDDRTQDFDRIVIAVPAEQAHDLLTPLGSPYRDIFVARDVSAPCWVVMLAFETPLDYPFDLALMSDQTLSKAVRNCSKPGRDVPEAWVLHASTDWSIANLEADKAFVETALIEAFRGLIDLPDPIHSAAHRWRYSQVTRPARTGSAWFPDLKLAVCGDWMVGDGVEAGWISAQHLVENMSSI